MTETREHLTNRLIEEGRRTVQFFSGISPDQCERTVYTDGACWTIRQVLGHFSTTEAGIRALMQSILGGGEGVPENFNINHYNEGKMDELGGVAMGDLLAGFQIERQATIDWVNGLNDAELDIAGRHPWLGMAPIGEMIQLLYRHNQIHQRDIRKLLAAE